MAKAAFVIAAIYLAAHLPFLAPSLEDIDSINFALGLREFNPALHQPHPPGHPLYIVLGHVSLPLVERLSSLGRAAGEAWALAIWSALGGALAIVAVWFFFRAIAERGSTPAAMLPATLLLAAAPLFWMSGLRPMSDMPGLALGLLAQALMLAGGRRQLIAGAIVAGLAAGVRVQTAAMTAPILAFAVLEQRDVRLGVQAAAGFLTACLAWGVPLVIASGGPAAYRAALNSQAGEDFEWVNMLWADPTPRHAAVALYQTLILPWSSALLAAVVSLAAIAGGVAMIMRERRAVVVLALASGPYLLFHLLFHQTDTVRYALPVLPVVSWLTARGLAVTGRLAIFVTVPLVAAALVVAVPAGVAYGREVHPAFRAIRDAVERARVQPPAAVYSHYGVRRALQAADTGPLRVVDPPTKFEWMGLVDYWRGGGTDPVWFLGDARRTDLALIDPRSRSDVVRYRWSVGGRSELSGTRPLGVDWYRLRVPAWFLGQGWSLTPETGGITDATAMGPDHRPIEGYVQRRPGPYHVLVGGRHLGVAGDADADVELAVDGTPVDRWSVTVGARNFLRFIELPAGVAGPGPFARVTISSHSAAPPRAAPLAIRQFDMQPQRDLIYGYAEGWHEAEYSVETGLSWRWTSERSAIRLEGQPQPVRLTVRGESPLRYMDAAPNVRITAGEIVVARFRPVEDFQWAVVIPADTWSRSGGTITIETDRVYLPGQAEGTADERHLGLRIFDLRIAPALP